MTVTASDLRGRIYCLLDQVIETGQPLEVKRKGRCIRIAVDPPPARKLERLVKRDCIVGDPEDLVSVDWSDTWSAQP
jgi:hypothetical protein